MKLLNHDWIIQTKKFLYRVNLLDKYLIGFNISKSVRYIKDRDLHLFNNINKLSNSNVKNMKFIAKVFLYLHFYLKIECYICKGSIRFVSTIKGFKKYCSSQCRANDIEWRTNHSILWKKKNINKEQTRKQYRVKNYTKVRKWSSNYFKTENGLKQKRVQNSKRRAKRLELKECFSSYDRELVLKRFSNKCFNCKSLKSLEIDHHYPLSKGFVLTHFNAVLLCKKCNVLKSSKLPEDFYSRKMLLKLNNILNLRKNK